MTTAAVGIVAVIGGGIAGSVCAATLAARGVAVTVFDSGRGPGGRTSQRREVMGDSVELRFDHGAPYFTVTDDEFAGMVKSWESRGLVAQWTRNFACFDRNSGEFSTLDKEGSTKKYVGIPGMNSVCKALCHEDGVETRFGVTVSKIDWLKDQSLWSLSGSEGQPLGLYDSVVVSDKNIFSTRFTVVTGRPPPLDLTLFPELSVLTQEIPINPCFVAMLAFSKPLSAVPFGAISFANSDVLTWAFCDSSKPGRSSVPPGWQLWVLHSTAEYAARLIARDGLRKPTGEVLATVAQELLDEFRSATGPNIPPPVFAKGHRWGSAFPRAAIGGPDKCVWDVEKKLAACGDFCTGPGVEGAAISGLRAASKVLGSLDILLSGL